ncbi:MAG: alpha-L-fucosidase, partial [Bacteroidales bacterium]|nr:alpha-L-fucosidase [Bacteroidales bacterium]
MKHLSITTTLLLGILFFAQSCTQPKAPEPFGAIPTQKQMDWQKLEYYMFIHFGPNTFTNVEWGDGKEDPKVFNPTNLDCRQWAKTAKDAGMKAIIITAKHHDGFCLFPSNYSTHTVRESLWKDGKGDVLRELAEACKEFGLLFGVYLSPWDQNHPTYGTADYNQVFANTLTEVLSNYGEVFEQWFDGARPKNIEHDYDWKLFNETVYRLHPNAVIFSDVGPDCRWMGNEKGIAGETNWSTINVEGFTPGWGAPSGKILNEGEKGGASWIPAEVDVSIRPGWFYSPATDEKVKSVEHLMDIWHTSVGRNANLVLNGPPDRTGRIHPIDSARLMEFRRAREVAFRENLAAGASAEASHTRGKGRKFAAKNVLNETYDSYWTTDDGILNPYLEINFESWEIFNRLELQEYIPLGQRVYAFRVQYWNEKFDCWADLTEGTTIGYKRILRFREITTQKIRIE